MGKSEFHLIVAGGGFAGVGAAITAARQGLKVLLVESSNCLGGAAVNCLVNPFMANHTVIENKRVELTQGIFSEITGRLRKMGGMGDYIFKEEYLKLLLNEMCMEAGVNLLFRATVVSAEYAEGMVKSLTVNCRAKNYTFFADYFIDATGDADLSCLAGVATRLGRPKDSLCQPMTLCFRINNVDMAEYQKEKGKINQLYREFKEQGRIKNPREDVLIFSSLYNGVLHFNSTRIVKLNPTDVFDLTKAEIAAREQVFELYYFLRDNFSAFKNSDIIMSAPQIGVRESRMIVGEYTMTGNDIMECRKFVDGIAAGNYDMDIHNPEGEGTSHYWLPEGEYYTIPYRSLVPKGYKNLLCAGRCISVDHEAQSSIRIMPICCSLGQAAGAAVALSSQNNVPLGWLNTDELRKLIKSLGGFIG